MVSSSVKVLRHLLTCLDTSGHQRYQEVFMGVETPMDMSRHIWTPKVLRCSWVLRNLWTCLDTSGHQRYQEVFMGVETPMDMSRHIWTPKVSRGVHGC